MGWTQKSPGGETDRDLVVHVFVKESRRNREGWGCRVFVFMGEVTYLDDSREGHCELLGTASLFGSRRIGIQSMSRVEAWMIY